MRLLIGQILSCLAVPLAVVLAVAVLLRGLVLFEPWKAQAEAALGIAVAAAVLLGLQFNRSRVVFAVLALWAAEVALRWARAIPGDPRSTVVFEATDLLLPVYLAAFAVLTERGLLTRYGARRAALSLLPAALVAWLAQPSQASLAANLHLEVIPRSRLWWTDIPQPGLAALMLAASVLIARLLVHRSPLDGGFVGSLAACGLGLDSADFVPHAAAYFTAAVLILAIALVQESHRMAYRDELTGLPGRRALNEEMLKLGSRYAIAMLDVDHFKKFNDTHGHDVGDQVLRLVATKLGGGAGQPFRYGGEEFAILFPGLSAREAAPHLEALRSTIEQARMTLRGKDRPRRKPRRPRARRGAPQVSVTVSIGVAEPDEERRTAREVMEAADQALYQAKRKGRNRVCVTPE